MKREISRKKRLPAFLINIDELEILSERILELFDNPDTVYVKIDISLPSEKLEFDSVHELKKYYQYKGRITKFSLYFSQNNRRISIRSNSLFDTLAEVSTTAENEAWCAGAIETAYSFLKSHQLWYNWFLSAPVGWVLFLFANVPSIANIMLPTNYSVDKPIIIGWLAITVTLATLYFLKGKLLPSTVLIVTEEEGFIKRNAAELSLLIAVISVILTVAGWFINTNSEHSTQNREIDKPIQKEYNKSEEPIKKP